MSKQQDRKFGYFTTVDEGAKRAKERGYGLSDSLPPGLGTIYSWDFAFTINPNIVNSSISGGRADSIYFRYIGQSAQDNTKKRITQHLSQKSGSIQDRRLYETLSKATDHKGEYKRTTDFPLRESGSFDSIVRVVHVASILDLATLESYMIQKGNGPGFGIASSGDGSTFESIINNIPSKYLLNTLGGGVGAQKAGTKNFIDLVPAAFFYLTENDNVVLLSRTNSMPKAEEVINRASGDYAEATTILLEEFGETKATNSSSYKDFVIKFYEKMGRRFSLGFKLDGGKNVLVEEKFDDVSLNAGIRLIFKIKSYDTQEAKKLFFNMIISEKEITDSLVKSVFNKAEEIVKSKISRTSVVEIIVKMYQELAKNLGSKSVVTITNQESPPPLDYLFAKIKQRLLEKTGTAPEKKEDVFSGKAIIQQQNKLKIKSFDYISQKDLKLIEEIIVAFSLNYYGVYEEFPPKAKISDIVGYFADSNKENIIKEFIKQGFSRKEAEENVKEITVQSEWTKKEKPKEDKNREKKK